MIGYFTRKKLYIYLPCGDVPDHDSGTGESDKVGCT